MIDIATENNLVFASTEQAGVWLLDVSDPASPEILYHLDNPYWAGPVELFGQYAYCFDGGLEFLVVGRPGDIDGDEIVGVQDLAALLAAFGTCREDAVFNALADLNSDGCVSVMDLAGLLARFGQ